LPIQNDILTEFYGSTSLHGWRFFGGNKCTVHGIFWIAVIAISIASAAYVMTTNIQGKTVNLSEGKLNSRLKYT